MGKKSTPAAPDYMKLAEMTANSSKQAVDQQTLANRANQYTPWGSNTWQKDPTTGQWSNYVDVDESMRHAVDSQNALQSGRSDLALSLFPRAQAEFGQSVDYSGLTPWANAPLQNTMGDVQGSNASRQRAEDAIYKSATSRLDPQFQAQQEQLTNQLAMQGITPGSSAYQMAMDNFQRGKSDAYSQAQLQSVTGAGAEAQRNQAMDLARAQGLWGQNLAGAGFQNQQRQQMMAELMQRRGFSLNEINAIISGQQVGTPQFAGYGQAGQAAATDYSGAGKAQYDASMDAYNAAQASSPLNAAASLAGTAMKAYTGGMSDARIKRDIKRVGTHPKGYGLYTYRFIGEKRHRFGVIAQDVLRYAPELVGSYRGVLMVADAALD